MSRWLRVVVPSIGWLASVALIYAAAMGFLAWLEWLVALPGAVLWQEPTWQLSRSILGPAAAAYGVWRVVGFHPRFRPAFRTWLAATPWSARDPLPFGPVHLVPQDLLLIGATTALDWGTGDPYFLSVPLFFLAAYLAFAALGLFLTGAWGWAYAVAFGLGLVVRLWDDRVVSLAMAGATYAAALVGLWRSLSQFPWAEVPWQPAQGDPAGFRLTVRDAVGWPLGALGPKFRGLGFELPFHQAMLLGGLAGWWVHAVAYQFPGFVVGSSQLRFHFLTGTLWALVMRVAAYCTECRPPIGFAGRLFTGRWIIPDYDVVFAAPVIAAATALALDRAAVWTGTDPLVAYPIASSIVITILLGVGPRLDVWRLTGGYRAVPGKRLPGEEVVG